MKVGGDLLSVHPGSTVVTGVGDEDALPPTAKSFQETYIRFAEGEAGLLSTQPDSRSSVPPL